jgi:hypothetical protein
MQDLFIALRRLSHSHFHHLFDSLSHGVSHIHLLDSGGASQAFGFSRGCGKSCGEASKLQHGSEFEPGKAMYIVGDVFLSLP